MISQKAIEINFITEDIVFLISFLNTSSLALPFLIYYYHYVDIISTTHLSRAEKDYAFSFCNLITVRNQQKKLCKAAKASDVRTRVRSFFLKRECIKNYKILFAH